MKMPPLGTRPGHITIAGSQPRPCVLVVTQDRGLLDWHVSTRITSDEQNQWLLQSSDPKPVEIHCEDGTEWTGQAFVTSATFSSGHDHLGTDFPLAAELAGTGELAGAWLAWLLSP